MLTPNELEAIPEPLVKLFRQLELDVMNDIIERIAVNKDISRTADWEISRLYELGVAKEVVRRQIKRALRLSEAEIDRIYSDVLAEDYVRYEPVYQRLGNVKRDFSAITAPALSRSGKRIAFSQTKRKSSQNISPRLS